MIKGILFDWNGTILDDVEACLAGANALFEEGGVKRISLQQFRDTLDIPLEPYIEKNGIPLEQYRANLVKYARIFRERYREHVVHCRARENAHSLLEWLREEEIKVGILSADMEEDIHHNLKRLDLEHLVDVVVGHRTLITGQHHSKDLPKAASMLNLPQKELLMVGDTAHDIRVAREFNVPVVAVTQGYFSTPRLQELKPDYLVDDLSEIQGIVQHLNNGDYTDG